MVYCVSTVDTQLYSHNTLNVHSQAHNEFTETQYFYTHTHICTHTQHICTHTIHLHTHAITLAQCVYRHTKHLHTHNTSIHTRNTRVHTRNTQTIYTHTINSYTHAIHLHTHQYIYTHTQHIQTLATHLHSHTHNACNTSHTYEWATSQIWMRHDAFICGTWLIHMRHCHRLICTYAYEHTCHIWMRARTHMNTRVIYECVHVRIWTHVSYMNAARRNHRWDRRIQTWLIHMGQCYRGIRTYTYEHTSHIWMRHDVFICAT